MEKQPVQRLSPRLLPGRVLSTIDKGHEVLVRTFIPSRVPLCASSFAVIVLIPGDIFKV